MKRGSMSWDKELLSEQELSGRREKLLDLMHEKKLDAVIVYGDVIHADELVNCSNYGPYWCNSAAVLTAGGSYFMVTGHNARVNPWLHEMTGLDEADLIPAGMKVPQKLAEALTARLGKGTVGLIGKYTPAAVARELREAGFEVCAVDEPGTVRAEHDAAYLRTAKKGHALMEAALEAALAKCEGMTVKRCCAEIEYAMRKAGAMDVVLLSADSGRAFALP